MATVKKVASEFEIQITLSADEAKCLAAVLGKTSPRERINMGFSVDTSLALGDLFVDLADALGEGGRERA
jgi:hypothetical protein